MITYVNKVTGQVVNTELIMDSNWSPIVKTYSPHLNKEVLRFKMADGTTVDLEEVNVK